MVTCSIHHSNTKPMDGSLLRRWLRRCTNEETVSHTLIISYLIRFANIRYRTTTCAWKGSHPRMVYRAICAAHLFFKRRYHQDISYYSWATLWAVNRHTMMMSSNGNIFRGTGPLWGESTGHRWIPLTGASDVELWCFVVVFICSWTNGWEKNETPVIWGAIALIIMSL